MSDLQAALPTVEPSLGSSIARSSAADVFAGGGEMGALMRAKAWTETPLGDPSTWPQSLRTTISIVLEARFPMVVAWGREFRFFYKDGYRQILGKTRHPGALGTPGAEIFPEVWSVVGPEFERVRPAFVALVGHRDVIGKPVREALPDVEGQGYFGLLDRRSRRRGRATRDRALGSVSRSVATSLAEWAAT